MLVGTIALTGLGIPFTGPGFAGFYSKDAIIEAAYMAHTEPGMYAFILGVTAAAMTSFYSWRLMFLTFHGEYRGDHHVLEHAHEAPHSMMIANVVLAVGAIVTGAAFYQLFVGEEALTFWRETLVVHEHAEEAIPVWVILSPFVASVLGLAIAYYYFILRPELPARMAAKAGMLYTFLYNKWYFDELYDFLFVRPSMSLGRLLWKVGDGTIIDGLGPDGIAARVLDATRAAVKLQTGYIYHYAFAMLVGAAALATWFLFSSGQV
jgi:NADH-quinone oxidoreductase subunit L